MKKLIAIGLILAITGIVLGTMAIQNPLGICYRGIVSFNSISEYHIFVAKVNDLPKVGGFTNDITVTEIAEPENITVFYRVYTPTSLKWTVPYDRQTDALGMGFWGYFLAVPGIAFIIAGVAPPIKEERECQNEKDNI